VERREPALKYKKKKEKVGGLCEGVQGRVACGNGKRSKEPCKGRTGEEKIYPLRTKEKVSALERLKKDFFLSKRDRKPVRKFLETLHRRSGEGEEWEE